jgi:transposase InsO family protein
MTINMNDSHVVSIAQIREFLQASQIIKFEGVSQKEKYVWIENTLNRFGYFHLRKKDKSSIKKYIRQMTGFSDAQLGRLIAKKKKIGKILAGSTKRHTFPAIYDTNDVARLLETDNNHSRLSGPATKRILVREYKVFGNKNYELLSKISISHIYNLRAKRQYTSGSLTYNPTPTTKVNIGERRKPRPGGKPGFVRVDSVHQGDLDKAKGVYHINLTDEVTQWEVIGCVEGISEKFMLPVLEDAIAQFPFKIINFHSDNGSEYINHQVATLLNGLLIKQTKSRSRHSNDNALAESKNGSVIRKHIGYRHIPKRHAASINCFYKECFNVYVNYHRPSGFSTDTMDTKGKIKKKYDHYLMPYEKFLSLENPEKYLRKNITLEMILNIAKEKSDNEYAAWMQKEKSKLFKSFKK